jgi:hypothetical protein
MRKYFDRYTMAGAAIAFLVWIAAVPSSTIAGILQAIIPTVVPTAKFQGTATNTTKFQGASGSTTNGHCAQYDGTGLLVDSGAGCVGSGSGTPGSTLFSSTTSAGPNNSAAETSLVGTVTGSTTISANTFTDGAVLESRSQGFFSLPAVADSITLKMKCGSTVIGSASTTLGAGVLTNGTFRFWLLITARGSGAGGSFITNGIAEFTGSALTPSEIKVLNTSTVAYDFTTSCAFDITAQWGAAQSGELITGTNAAAWFPGAPVTSVGGLTGAVKSGFQGNGTLIQASTGSTVSGDCVKYDANGNTVDAGAACGTGSGGGSFTLLEEHTANNSGTSLNFATRNVTGQSGTTFQTDFDDYQIEVVSLLPATNGANIILRFSSDSGSNYSWAATRNSAAGTAVGGSAGTTSIGLDNSGGQSNSTTLGGAVFTVWVYSPTNASFHPRVHWSGSINDGSGNPDVNVSGGGSYLSTTSVTTFEILASSGNLVSGTVRCYGIAK